MPESGDLKVGEVRKAVMVETENVTHGYCGADLIFLFHHRKEERPWIAPQANELVLAALKTWSSSLSAHLTIEGKPTSDPSFHRILSLIVIVLLSSAKSSIYSAESLTSRRLE